MIYFTADTHFGHENVIRFCGRPFSCAAEMDEALIANWNSRVKGNDTVYIQRRKFTLSADKHGLHPPISTTRIISSITKYSIPQN